MDDFSQYANPELKNIRRKSPLIQLPAHPNSDLKNIRQFSALVQSSAHLNFELNNMQNIWQMPPFVPLPPIEQVQLTYSMMFFAMAASAVGAYLHILFNFGGWLSWLASIVCLCVISTVHFKEHKKLESSEMGLFMVAAVLRGPSLYSALGMDQSGLVRTFVGYAIVFGCYTAAALLAKTRNFPYLGALFLSTFSTLFWLSLDSTLFGGSKPLCMTELFWLLFFAVYLAFETDEIIDRAKYGDYHYVKHAVNLFYLADIIYIRALYLMAIYATDVKGKKRVKKYAAAAKKKK